MNATIPLLAQPLAPDNIWFVLLVVAISALMHNLGALRDRDETRRHKQGHWHGIGHWLQEMITHRHH